MQIATAAIRPVGPLSHIPRTTTANRTENKADNPTTAWGTPSGPRPISSVGTRPWRSRIDVICWGAGMRAFLIAPSSRKTRNAHFAFFLTVRCSFIRSPGAAEIRTVGISSLHHRRTRRRSMPASSERRLRPRLTGGDVPRTARRFGSPRRQYDFGSATHIVITGLQNNVFHAAAGEARRAARYG